MGLVARSHELNGMTKYVLKSYIFKNLKSGAHLGHENIRIVLVVH